MLNKALTVNWLWKSLVVAVALIACCYVGMAGWKAVRYFQLSAVAEVELASWSVQKAGNDKFKILATYDFNGKTAEQPLRYFFRNQFAAEDKARKLEALTVWYDPKHPHRFSLDHQLPIKSCAYAVILIGVGFWFWRLKRLVVTT